METLTKKNPKKSRGVGQRCKIPTVIKIRQHYKQLGLNQRWTMQRFNRLCRLMNCLPEELAAICCVSITALVAAGKNDSEFSLCASLHFAMIESFVIEFKTGLKVRPAMPIDLIYNSQAKK